MASCPGFFRSHPGPRLLATLAALLLFGAGCGPSAKELARREEVRRNHEQHERMLAAQAAEAEAARAAAEAARTARAAELARLEAEGDEAAKAGRLNKALSAYLELLPAVSGDAAADHRVRLKVIAVAVAMTPPPAVPEEARRYAVRAAALVKAQQAAGYVPAAAELRKAVDVAPWWADGYYNLGLMQEGAEEYGAAARSLGLCLKADPQSPNAEAVQTKVYELEVLQEAADKVRGMAGAWTNKVTGRVYQATMDGKSFHARNANGFVVRGTLDGNSLDGTITVPAAKGWDNNDCWTPEYTVPMTGKVGPDMRTLTFQYMENRYSPNYWNITGSGPNRTGRTQGECVSVTLVGNAPSDMVLVR
ncbi:hypothetical protein EPO15_03590 [bacterium]|nr:MAG: hypothetical protein EPO15_03590 [bacterium]